MSTWRPGVAKIPLCRCLACGHEIDASGALDGSNELPEPGSIVVCIRCGAVMMHAQDMTLRGMTDEEMDEVTADKELMNNLAKNVRKVHLLRHSVG